MIRTRGVKTAAAIKRFRSETKTFFQLNKSGPVEQENKMCWVGTLARGQVWSIFSSMRRFSATLVASGILLVWLSATAAAQAQPGSPTYWKDIRPVFRKHCTVCHSAKNVKEPEISGGLALDSYGAFRKGTGRRIFQAGKSNASLVIQLLETSDKKKRMPLDASPLAKETIGLIRQWIDKGAPEGTKPQEKPVELVAKSTAKTRKLEVILPTNAIAPAGILGKGGGKLELRMKVGPLAPLTAVAFSPDNKLLATGSYGQAAVWDLTKGQAVKVLTNVLGAVNDVRFSPDGKILAMAGGQASAKGDLRLYQVGDWKLVAALRGHDDSVFSVDFSNDGQLLASASFDKTVRIWNVPQLRLERVLPGHSDFVYAVAFSPDAKYVVSCSKDRTVKLVETASGKGVFTFGGMDQDIMAVAYSPDGKQIVSSGYETALYWWNPQTGDRIRAQGGHGVAVNELRFSKDGSRLVSAASDGTLRIWNGETGAQMKAISVGSIVYAAAISANNKLVASGSYDGMARVWDEASGRLLLTVTSFPGDGEQGHWLAITPEGYTSASGKLPNIAKWLMAGQEAAAGRAWMCLQRPEMLAKSVSGEKLPPPTFRK